MTTDTATRETLEGILESASDAKRGAKTVKVFAFRQRPTDKYLTSVVWWPPREGSAIPPPLEIGRRYRVSFDKKSTGEEGKFYRDFVEATPLGEARPPAPVPEQPWAARPSAPPEAERPRAYDARNTSIERQVALKAAVEVALAYESKGLEGGPEIVAAILGFAEQFAAFLAGTPQEQAQTAQEPALEPMAAPAGVPMDYTAFYAWAKANGWDIPKIAAKLGMMPDRWLKDKPGRTLEDAIRTLESA